MSIVNRLTSLVKTMLHRNEAEAELKEEIRFHIERETEENIAQGMPPRSARQAALSAFGSEALSMEECRASWGVRFFDEFVNDTRFAFRQMWKHPVYTGTVVCTLAICLGANTTAFSFLYNLILKPYIYTEPDRIVQLGKQWDRHGDLVSQVSTTHYHFIKEHATFYESIGFLDDEVPFDLHTDNGVLRVGVDRVTPGIWSTMGVQPFKGRTFTEEDVESSGGRIALISYLNWKRMSENGQPVIGSEIRLDDQSYEVIGVMPAGFYMNMVRSDAWIPRLFNDWELGGGSRNDHSYQCYARLKPGITVEQADAEMKQLWRQFDEVYPEDKEYNKRAGSDFGAASVNNVITQNIPAIEAAFMSIQAVTIFVLLIGCLNVGGMIMVRGYARLGELSMRRALGASNGRIIRQLLTEITLLFLISGSLSLLVLHGGFAAGRWLRINEVPWGQDWVIDTRIMLITLGASLATAMITAIIPIFSILRTDLYALINSGGRTASGRRGKKRLHAFFVTSQVAISLILLVAALLLIQNMRNLEQREVGFERENRVALVVPQPRYRFGRGEEAYFDSIQPFRQRALEALGEVPGVRSVAGTNRIPMSYFNQGHSSFSFPHYTFGSDDEEPNALRQVVTPGYFKTVNTRLLAGRDFEETDTRESQKVVIVSEEIVARFFQDLDPIGATLNFWGEELRIVGVAEAVQDKPYFLWEADYTLYFPFSQWHQLEGDQTTFIAHVNGDPAAYAETLRQTLLRMDPQLTISTYTFDEIFEIAVFAQQLPMRLTMVFSGLAIFLTTLGLYGLISYTVVERTKEFGIRMALGAQRSRVLRMVFQSSGVLVIAGIAIGATLAYWAAEYINPFLEDYDATRPSVYVVVIAFVAAVSGVASFIPAQRATRINVAETLRYE